MARTWNYNGDPANNERDEVRFLAGDTNEADPLIYDEEIAYALAQHPEPRLAAAMCLRAQAALFARKVSRSVGDVSRSLSDAAKAFTERANELDPYGITRTATGATPVFGGQSISEKETLDSDTDAVQPFFKRGKYDYPGLEDDSTDEVLSAS